MQSFAKMRPTGLAKFEYHGKEFQYCHKSLYCFSSDSRVRRACVWTMELRSFKLSILLAVILNSVWMAAHSYYFRLDMNLPKNTEAELIAAKVFLAVFSIEMVIKVIGMGFVRQKNSYLRSPFNVLDFLMLLTAIFEQTPLNVDTFLFLRTLRVLKPLRSIKQFPSLQILITSLFRALLGLAQVYATLTFMLTFFANIGIHIFGGNEYRACRATPEIVDTTDPATGETTQVWPFTDEFRLCIVDSDCEEVQPGSVCGSVWEKYGLDPHIVDVVIDNENIFYGIVGYDHFIQGMITTLQVCTLEGWSALMYTCMDTLNYPAISVIFYYSLVGIGAFVILNLVLAQIMETYSSSIRKQEEPLTHDVEELNRLFSEKLNEFSQQISAGSALVSPISSSRSHHSSNRSNPSIAGQQQQMGDPLDSNLAFEDQKVDSADGEWLAQIKKSAAADAKYKSETIEVEQQAVRISFEQKSADDSAIGAAAAAQPEEFQTKAQESKVHESKVEKKKHRHRRFRTILLKQRDQQSQQNVSAGHELPRSIVSDQRRTVFYPESAQLDSQGEDSQQSSKEDLKQAQKQLRLNQQDAALIQIEDQKESSNALSISQSQSQSQRHSQSQGESFKRDSVRHRSSRSSIKESSYVNSSHQGRQIELKKNAAGLLGVQKSKNKRKSKSFASRNATQNIMSTNAERQDAAYLNTLGSQDQTLILQNSLQALQTEQTEQIFEITAANSEEKIDQNEKEEQTIEAIHIDQIGDPEKQKRCFLCLCCNRFVSHPLFNIVITLMILMNTIAMATYSYEETEEQANFRELLDDIFVAIFTLEFVFKMIGLGPKSYWRDSFNKFDAFVVVIALVDQGLAMSTDQDGEKFVLLQFFKALRTIRVLKLARFNAGMRRVMQQTAKSLSSIVGFSSLLFLFMYIWALMGMELFAYRAVLDQNEDYVKSGEALSLLSEKKIANISFPRPNFNDMFQSHVSVYILITGEDWNVLMYDYVRAMDKSLGRGWWIPKAYCIIGIIVGNFTLLALFTGILLQAFSEQSNQDKASHKMQEQLDFEEFWHEPVGSKENAKRHCCSSLNKVYRSFGAESDKTPSQRMGKGETSSPSLSRDLEDGSQGEAKSQRSAIEASENKNQSQIPLHYMVKSKLDTPNQKMILKQGQLVPVLKSEIKGTSLGLFSDKNKFRLILGSIAKHNAFEAFIMLLIACSSVQLMIDTPLMNPESNTIKVMKIADFVFTGIFTIEALTKIIAFGFACNGKYSYLRNIWNLFDFFIVLGSLLDMTLADSFSGLRVIRIIRIFRPIRIVARNQRLQLALSALLKSMPQIIRLQVLTMFFLFMFAICQTRLYSGEFHYCYTEHLGYNEWRTQKLIANKWQCLNYGGEWIRPDFNFDSLTDSFTTLLSIGSSEGWTSVLWSITDAVGVDLEPQRDTNRYFGPVYTISVLFIISLLFLNLFIGVVVETFNRQKQLSSYNQVLSPAQRDYVKVLLLTFQKKPLKTADSAALNKLRKLCMRVTEKRSFEILILACIIVNAVVLATDYFMMSQERQLVNSRINTGFVIVFAIEAAMKIIARKTDYFRDPWNRFDFVIVFLTLAFYIPASMGHLVKFQGLISTLRMLRIAHVLRLVVRAEKMQIIYRTLAETVPTLGSFSILLLIVLFIFSVIAVKLFALIDLRPIPGLDRQLGRHANFQSFVTAFMTLFRCATGEAWNSIMFELTWQRSILFQCNEDESYHAIVAAGRDPGTLRGPRGCGNYTDAFIFFSVFNIFVSQVYLNLVVAIIVDAFTGVSSASEGVDERLLDAFVKVWAKYDRSATCFIQIEQLDSLIVDLLKHEECQALFLFSEELTVNKSFREKVISSLEIPTFDNLRKVMFYDVIQKLAYRSFKINHNGIRVRLLKLKFFSQLSQSRDLTALLLDGDILNLKRDFEIDLEDARLNKLESENKRVDLIVRLRQQVMVLKNKYSQHVDRVVDSPTSRDLQIVSINEDRDQQQGRGGPNQGLSQIQLSQEEDKAAIELYTTKHYIAGLIILRRWHKYRRERAAAV